MHSFDRIHSCRNIVDPCTNRYLNLDLSQFFPLEKATTKHDLPGFVADGVTYESHHFWIYFIEKDRRMTSADGSYLDSQFSAVYVVIHHGAGWEVWRGDYLMAAALFRYGDDHKGLFYLCWSLTDAVNSAIETGQFRARQEYRHAFVEGRLKKRKMPGKGEYKVWIEPKPAA